MRSTRDMLHRMDRRGGDNEAPMRTDLQGLGGFRPICPMSAASEREASPAAREQSVQRTVVAQPIRENSVYRQLMRSHDRVSTRHLKDNH